MNWLVKFWYFVVFIVAIVIAVIYLKSKREFSNIVDDYQMKMMEIDAEAEIQKQEAQAQTLTGFVELHEIKKEKDVKKRLDRIAHFVNTRRSK